MKSRISINKKYLQTKERYRFGCMYGDWYPQQMEEEFQDHQKENNKIQIKSGHKSSDKGNIWGITDTRK